LARPCPTRTGLAFRGLAERGVAQPCPARPLSSPRCLPSAAERWRSQPLLAYTPTGHALVRASHSQAPPDRDQALRRQALRCLGACRILDTGRSLLAWLRPPTHLLARSSP